MAMSAAAAGSEPGVGQTMAHAPPPAGTAPTGVSVVTVVSGGRVVDGGTVLVDPDGDVAVVVLRGTSVVVVVGGRGGGEP